MLTEMTIGSLDHQKKCGDLYFDGVRVGASSDDIPLRQLVFGDVVHNQINY
jgi:hypothetical protein